MKIERKEIKYGAAGFIFMMLWFLWLKDLIAPALEGMNHFFAMIIYNLGFLIGIYFIAGFLNGKHKIKTSTIVFMLFIGTNILMGPYLVSKQGVIQKGVEMWFAAGDVGIASLWQSIGITGTTLWFFTYIVSGFLLIFLIPILISDPKKIYKAIKQ